MTPHEEKDAYVVDLTLRALPHVEPFVVCWQGVQFERNAGADPARLRGPSTPAKTSRATYKVGSVAELYGELLETMPPLKHDKDPSMSEVVSFICTQVATVEGECSLSEGLRIYYCLANMSKKNGPLVFERSTRLWRGRKYHV
jgi:hypothetical protein